MFSSFGKFAGLYAMLAAVSGFLYSVSFVVLKNPLLFSIFLTLGGIFTTAAIVGIYQRVREADEGFAFWGLLLALVGAGGSAIHGAYDLANAVKAPAANAASLADLPSQIDPRGFLTFGVAGLGTLVLAWLILRNGAFTRNVGYVGLLSGLLLVVIYLGRLLILDPNNPLLLGPAALEGFIVNPVFLAWVGWLMWKAPVGVTARPVANTPTYSVPPGKARRR